jgi:hypothetical protein
MSIYLETEWKRLCEVLSNKNDYTVFVLPHYNDSKQREVIEWLEDHNFPPMKVIFNSESPQTIPSTFEDGTWYVVENRGGTWLIVFDRDIALEFRLTFGYETCHPLAPMIRAVI